MLDAGCWMLDAGSARPSRDGGACFQNEPASGDSFGESGARTVSYRNLQVWKLARELTIEIHAVTVQSLPRHEMYEEGSQIRRSIKSVRSNIVEGYSRRRYKHDFIRFLTYALSSCDESRDHLEVLFETGSLQDGAVYARLAGKLDSLGKQLNNLITSVERDHRSVRETLPKYAEDHQEHSSRDGEYPASSIQHPASDQEKSD
jgi:four helix bundle protein